jgi:hypothetical protein
MRKQQYILRTLMVAAVLAIAAAAIAGSGALGLRVDRGPKTVKRMQPRLVTMEGMLQLDRLGSWTLDGKIPLQQAPEMVWIDERDREETSPASGRTVLVSGQWFGGAFLVRHAVVLSPERMVQREMIRMPVETEEEEPPPMPE